MSDIYDLADECVAARAALHPILATLEGVSGFDGEMTDYSPDGFAQRHELERDLLRRIKRTPAQSRRDSIAKGVMVERLEGHAAAYQSGDYLTAMSQPESAGLEIVYAFFQMPYETSDDWEVAAKRLAQVPKALKGYEQLLRTGLETNAFVGRRQVLACAEQARIWAGANGKDSSFFGHILAERRNASVKGTLGNQLETEAGRSAAAFNEFRSFLLDEYLPKTKEIDGVGRDRYVRAAQAYLGMQIDPKATYEWGWQELGRLDGEIENVISQIKPGASIPEVVEYLDRRERALTSQEALLKWLQGFIDHTFDALDGNVFDIPAPLRHLDVRLGAPGGPENQYYSPPSDDLTVPGTYVYPFTTSDRFPIWKEITTAFHEGVPGHHLQVGTAKLLQDDLSRFQRNVMISGHGEGWALYAERLMDELGFYQGPAQKLDKLLSEYFRSARVVVDIGLHLDLSIPPKNKFHGGEKWTPQLAHDFMLEHSNHGEAFIESEILRYLGDPGQAISYKVGEKVFLDARERAQSALGDEFDLKTWHTDVLTLGPMGLQQFQALAAAPELRVPVGPEL